VWRCFCMNRRTAAEFVCHCKFVCAES
jgi:hypothetical protein